MLIGAAALSMVCGPVILHFFRSSRLKRQLSLFQYVCVKPISTTAPATRLNAASQFDVDEKGDDKPSFPDSPSPSSYYGWLGSLAPKFGVNGNNIELLSEPKEFYETLKSLSRSAKKRIVLTSLYLGTDSLEQELVEVIRQRVNAEHRGGDGDLHVRVLLDYSRGSRGKKSSSRSILLPLVQDFPDIIKVSLFHSPDLRGLTKLALPERVNEVVGLQHMKLYIFDNSLVISGANLSSSYFENRQDRYILIKNCDEIANFFAALVEVVSSFSFLLQPNGSTSFPAEFPHHPFHGFDGGERFRTAANSAVESLLHEAAAAADPTAESCQLSSCPVMVEKSPLLTALKRNAGRRNTVSAVSSPNYLPPDHKPPLPATCTNDSQDCSKEATKKETSTNDREEIDTWLYPLVQMGPLGIHVDSTATEALIESAPLDAQICLASGYFNLTQNYMDVILDKSKADFQILMASPKVNGFYGAHGLSGHIPAVYTNIAKQFHSQVIDRDQDSRIALHEFSRDDWTFHAKGLWYYMPGESLPSLTLIGSPNFGFRSVSRDLEAQLAVVTENRALRLRLDEERRNLYSRASRVDRQTFSDDDHAVPNWVVLVTDWIKNYF